MTMASRISTLFVLVGVVATCFAQQQCGCQQQPTVIQLSCGNGGQGSRPPPPGHQPPPPPPPPAFQTTTSAAYPTEEFYTTGPPTQPPSEEYPPDPLYTYTQGPPAQPPSEEYPPDPFNTYTTGPPAQPPAEEYYTGPPAPEEPHTTEEPAEEHRWNLREDMDRNKCIFDSDGYPYDYNGISYSDLKFPDGFKIDWESNESEVPEGLPVPPKNWDGYAETLGFPVPEKGSELYNMLLCFRYDHSENDNGGGIG